LPQSGLPAPEVAALDSGGPFIIVGVLAIDAYVIRLGNKKKTTSGPAVGTGRQGSGEQENGVHRTSERSPALLGQT
jgi:hypothetical protein